MTITPCDECHGQRLKQESLAVTVADKNIAEMCDMSVGEMVSFLETMELSERQKLIGEQVLKEIKARIGFLNDVGLDYLTLSRATGTLSGGEAQRIRLATQIGSGLVGVAYILDEPSIGLHQRDNDKLIRTLKNLRDLGNTLIVVEHDEDTMLAADYIVDIGPKAGEYGGEVVATGTAKQIMKNKKSITGAYLSGKIKIPVPQVRRKPSGFLKVVGAQENNLKNIDVEIPLGIFTCVTGVSGSGKSSLVNQILYKRLAKELNRAKTKPGLHKDIEGFDQLDKIIAIDQSPIGRTPRSNPATYTGVFDQIRDLFAMTKDAKAKGYNKGRFSFNKKGGRCEACAGDGIIKIEMHFLPDVYVPCEVCHGKRYNRETLEVKYKGKSIYDVLNMTVEEALTFFENVPSIYRKIETLYQVGLSYIRLGQPSTTLSGGEAQRIKLATELSRKSTGKTIGDEEICWMVKEGFEPNDLKFVLDQMSICQIRYYLVKQSEKSGDDISHVLQVWNDYLSMAKRLGMDIHDSIIYRTRDLQLRHKEAVLKIEEMKRGIRRRELEEKYVGFQKHLIDLKEKYEFSDGEYQVIAPKNIDDILYEGDTLHHCVNKTDTYFDRIVSKESYILFLREKENPKVPFYTLEVEPDGTIRQKRAEFNRQNKDIDKVTSFLTLWQKEIQKRLTKKDRKSTEESRKLRQQNYQEIRDKHVVVHGGAFAGELLADLLEKDLMDLPVESAENEESPTEIAA